jgi:putative spermidine/putrescine transport system permease protein
MIKRSLGAFPALILLLPIMGIGIIRVVLGAFGVWQDYGSSKFSLTGFHEISSELAKSIFLTFLIASISTVLALSIGTLTAYSIYRSRRRVTLLKITVALVLLTPHLVSAVSINLLLGDSGFLARLLHPIFHHWPQFVAGPLWLGVIFDFAWKESAFVAVMVLAALPHSTSEMVEVARMLRSDSKRVARQVLLPLVKPGLILSGGLAFIYAVGSYEASWLLGRSYPEPLAVLTYRLFTNSDLGFRSQAYASAMISLLIIAGTSLILVLWLRKLPARS